MKAPDPGKVLHLHTGSSAHFCHPAAVSEAWEHAYLHHPWAQTNSLHFCPVLSTHALSVPGSAPTCAAVVQLSSFPGRLPSRSLTLCTTTHSARASRLVTLPPLVLRYPVQGGQEASGRRGGLSVQWHMLKGEGRRCFHFPQAVSTFPASLHSRLNLQNSWRE